MRALGRPRVGRQRGRAIATRSCGSSRPCCSPTWSASSPAAAPRATSPTSSSSRRARCCRNDDERRRALPPAITTKIRDFAGETPLQVLAKQGDYQPTAMTAQRTIPVLHVVPVLVVPRVRHRRPRAGIGPPDAAARARPRRVARRSRGSRTSWTPTARTSAPTSRSAVGSKVATSCARTTGGSTTVTGATCASRTATGRTRRHACGRIRPIDVNGFVMFWYHPDPRQAPLWEIPELPEYADATSGPNRSSARVERALPVAGARRERSRLRAPEDGARRGDGARDREPSPTTRGSTTSAPASTSRRPRGPQPGRIDTDSWGPGFSVARFSGIIDTMFLATTTPIDWEWTQSIKVYRVKKLGPDAAALEQDAPRRRSARPRPAQSRWPRTT